MSQSKEFVRKLESMKEGERSRLRRLAGQPLHRSLDGFDLFTGLWWPQRQKNKAAPRRETSWLVTKLFCAFPLPHVEGNGGSLPVLLGAFEPIEEQAQRRYRARFDTLLQANLTDVEHHLHWALQVVADAKGKNLCPGVDWAQLLDDLSIWDRGDEHRLRRDIRDIWAVEYLKAVRVL